VSFYPHLRMEVDETGLQNLIVGTTHRRVSVTVAPFILFNMTSSSEDVVLQRRVTTHNYIIYLSLGHAVT
jgi:hypothetical protein